VTVAQFSRRGVESEIPVDRSGTPSAPLGVLHGDLPNRADGTPDLTEQPLDIVMGA
jgi:hypothetical protein